MSYLHHPVLLNESVQALITDREGIYVDLTFGGGGHSNEILKRLGRGAKLFAFDRDERALLNTISDDRIHLIHSDYRYLEKYLRYFNIPGVNGILADLGVSSYHFDESDRGFSFQVDTPLDMRMNTDQSLTADEVLMSYSETKLEQIMSEYGEITNAAQWCPRWVKDRRVLNIHTCSGFADWLGPFVYGKKQRYLAQVFQALRIEVNGELESLESMLQQAMRMLIKGGRMVVISYHSLEDRMVKNIFKSRIPETGPIAYGRNEKIFQLMNKDVITPGVEEIKINSRARSAKMRVGIKQI